MPRILCGDDHDAILCGASGGFDPLTLEPAAFMLNTAEEGDVTEWTELVAGNHAVEGTSSAAPVAGAGGKLVFGPNSILRWPLDAANNDATTFALAFRFKPSTLLVVHELVVVHLGTGGANARRIRLQVATTRMAIEIWDPSVGGNNGRRGQTATGIVSAADQLLTYEYHGGYETEDLRGIVTHNGTAIPLTWSSFGTPDGITDLPTATGNALIGGFQDFATPSNPAQGDLSSWMLCWNAVRDGAEQGVLTNADRALLQLYRPIT